MNGFLDSYLNFSNLSRNDYRFLLRLPILGYKLMVFLAAKNAEIAKGILWLSIQPLTTHAKFAKCAKSDFYCSGNKWG